MPLASMAALACAPPRAHSWSPDVLPSLPLGLGHLRFLGSLDRQFHINIRTSSGKLLGVTGKILKSFKITEMTRKTEVHMSWTLKNFSYIL